jgi:chromosome segregation ATPase
MAHAHGLTKEEIFNAASEIFASGKNPTQAAVRSKLGKGSFSTISKYLAEWREQQTDAEALTQNDEDMPDEVRLLLKRSYGAIRAHVEAFVIGEQVGILEEENAALKEKQITHDAIAAELTGLRFAYQESMNRLDQLTRENERVVQWLPQINQIEQMTQERDRLNEELVSVQARNEELEAAIAHLEDQLQTSQRNLQTSIERANGMSEELATLTAANTKMNAELSIVADRNLELIDRVELLEKSLSEKLAAIEELQNELKVAKTQPTKPASKTRSSRKLKGEQLALPSDEPA